MAAYTLGFMNDRRAVEPLARAVNDPVADVRYDAAAALLRLGDDRGFAPLIAGLEDADPRLRARSLGNLHAAVGETFGFEADGDPLERSAAVARWRGWLERRREGGS
jgi:HEAT repeat protein